MPFLSNISTVLPEFRVTTEHMPAVAQTWLGDESVAKEKFLRISAQSGVQERGFAFPHSEILALNGMQHRAAQFETAGTQFLITAIENALSLNGEAPEDIGGLVFTSCSIPSIPCIDAAAILQTELPNTIPRIPIYQHGCAGGVVGLGIGARLARLGKPIMVASVELCSLVFQPRNHTGAHLVGGAIFADGAAATIISPSSGAFEIVDTQSHLLPDSRHLMGYDIFDDGFHLRLDRSLPSVLIEYAPTIVEDFLRRNNKVASDIHHWLFHPGGIKILNFLKDTFKLEHSQCTWSYDVLREHGNLSSATILYVLQAFMKDVTPAPGKRALVMGIGPGLTVELILLEA